MKKIFCTLLAFLFLSLGSCMMPKSEPSVSNTIKETAPPSVTERTILIPDISGIDEATAKTLLAGKGLIPKVVYDYSDTVPEGQVVMTTPAIGSYVYEDDIITITISKGKRFYYLSNSVGYMTSVYGIEDFSWGDNGTTQTKGFYTPYVKEGFLYIEMFLCCVSDYELAFYGDFGTASINDTFDKTVPIKVIYDNIKVDNNGKETNFTVKIPLNDLGVQKPTNIYIEFDFEVNGIRRDFEAGFDLSW